MDSPITPLLQQALAASAQGDNEAALALFSQAAQEEPSSGIPHLLIGAEYAALGQADKAETAFANAVLLAPDLAIARYQLGLLQFSSARVGAALITWQPLLALGELNPLPSFVLGFTALAQDDFETARSYFETGISLNTDNPPLTSDIEKVLRNMDMALAALDAEKGKSSSDDSEASHILLSNYHQQGLAH
jgi:tetratricopeptide (TPR) repeat protein